MPKARAQGRAARLALSAGFVVAFAIPAWSQTIDDGIMLPKRTLFTGALYTHERWSEYWEGTLKRDNDNVGTVTTEVTSWTANYGITDKLNVIGTVPFVSTHASSGVLHDIDGIQDLTLAAKYSFLEGSPGGLGHVRAITVLSAGIPLTDYNPELPPLSIGSGSNRLSWRGTLYFQSDPGWFANGTSAYTWRGDVTLDRPYYFTDEFVMSNEVDMPNVFDWMLSGGYMKDGLMLAAMVSQQRTLGGTDIRRQDMPLVSNRMNFNRVGGMAMVPIPKLRVLVFQAAYAHTLSGRNVGQADTITVGLQYLLGSAPR